MAKGAPGEAVDLRSIFDGIQSFLKSYIISNKYFGIWEGR